MCVWRELVICSFANHSVGVQCTITAFVRASMLLFYYYVYLPGLAFSQPRRFINHIDCNRIVEVDINKAQLLVSLYFYQQEKKTSP